MAYSRLSMKRFLICLWACQIFLGITRGQVSETAALSQLDDVSASDASTQPSSSGHVDIMDMLMETIIDAFFPHGVIPQNCEAIEGNSTLTVCDNDSPHLLKVSHIYTDTYPYQPGNVTFTAKVKLSGGIPNGSYVNINVLAGFKEVYKNEHLDLCQILDSIGYKCPLPAWSLTSTTLKKTFTLPTTLRPGKYISFATAYTPSGKEIISLNTSFKFVNSEYVKPLKKPESDADKNTSSTQSIEPDEKTDIDVPVEVETPIMEESGAQVRDEL